MTLVAKFTKWNDFNLRFTDRFVSIVWFTCHLISCLEGLSEERPGHSCRRLKERNPEYRSGYYWVKHKNNQDITKPYMRVYCEMDDGLGWMLIGEFSRKTREFSRKSRCYIFFLILQFVKILTGTVQMIQTKKGLTINIHMYYMY